ncbi:MAG: DUF4230 domain-containing protein [Chloroflexi bacterium]|nr:DUF4230 domain-containing protein [Chloroflexota bacterium]
MINRGFHVGVAEGLCSHGADFSAQGVIEAGINFDDINDENINYDPSSQSYTLKLPATEFTSCRIDYIRLTRADFSMCNPDFDRARQFAEFQVMLEFVEKSREDGLLEEAEERSTLILGDFVRNLTGKPVHVTFEEREGEPTMSASCHPEIPGDWHYDRSRNAWRKRDGR